jgi:hypothetical protein
VRRFKASSVVAVSIVAVGQTAAVFGNLAPRQLGIDLGSEVGKDWKVVVARAQVAKFM